MVDTSTPNITIISSLVDTSTKPAEGRPQSQFDHAWLTCADGALEVEAEWTKPAASEIRRNRRSGG
jgi:hypothetical protein